MFDSQDEITQKLGNCVIIYRDRPFYVFGGKTSKSLSGYFTGTPDVEEVVNIKDPDLNFRSLGEKLGYLNLDKVGRTTYKEATFLMRMATRRSHQGLHETNVFISGLNGNPRLDLPPIGRMTWGSDIFQGNHKAMTDMINDKYPTVKEIRSEMKDQKVTSRAFHRHWCIRRDIQGIGPFELLYKMDKVGYTEDLDRLVLADRYKLMRKDMEKAYARN